MFGGNGDDSLTLGFGNDQADGGDGDDMLTTVDGANEADGPDLLNGGDGADSLTGDNGDQMRGGDGLDQFGVVYEVGNDPVAILDYDKAGGEVILITHPDGDTATLTATETAGDTNLLVNGTVVAVLAGVTGADLSLVSLIDGL